MQRDDYIENGAPQASDIDWRNARAGTRLVLEAVGVEPDDDDRPFERAIDRPSTQ
jgi:hypothetical protein